ncbi:uncharacterized protein LOC127160429 [Labeo rohita]|uniref:uncharacterized protein LOC127160429 n=1 Tax=Labeo rohita TaxID=84645 RepID=UPI0021E1EB1A|nr:uncharacterized protein LOC127160429 [Labeo rohita]
MRVPTVPIPEKKVFLRGIPQGGTNMRNMSVSNPGSGGPEDAPAKPAPLRPSTDVQCNEGTERFRHRLKLDNQTGSLAIMNINTTDSGTYELEIITNRINIMKRFNAVVHGASGVDTDKVSVMVEDSVTLHTKVKINQKDIIKWFLDDTRIAQIIGNLSTCTDVQCNLGTERFKDRLKLDHQTGSLTIMNINTTDSGPYQLQVTSSSSSGRTDHCKIFSVTVNDVPADEITSMKEGEPVTLDPGVMSHPDCLFTWIFNDVRIAEINGDPSKTCIDVQCQDSDGRFRVRLKVNQTGFLTIMNTRTTDSGVYQLQVISSNVSITKITSLKVTGSSLSPAAIAGLSTAVLVLLVVAAAAAGVFYFHK